MAEQARGGVAEKRKLLMQIDLFSHLSQKEADSVLSLMREQRIRKNTVVFHQFDETGGMYLILEGSIKISRVGRDG